MRLPRRLAMTPLIYPNNTFNTSHPFYEIATQDRNDIIDPNY